MSSSVQPGCFILIVVVRYQMPLEHAPVMRSLEECFARQPELRQSIEALVWDNSPEPLCTLPASFPFTYRHSPQNLGVSGAYNRAMALAVDAGCRWLLLLDQDTTLPGDFLAGMLQHAERLAGDEQVAAVAPTILVGERIVSPKVTARFRGSRDVPPGYQGLCHDEVVLVNTGLLLRVASLQTIGGFSPEFWLDFSDRYLCHMLARHGMAVWLAGELRLAHHISLMGGEGGMSGERYANLLDAEDAYFALYKSPARNLVYAVRLLRGAWQDRHAHPERAKLQWWHLLRRLYMPRAMRLRAWRTAVAERGIAIDQNS